MMRLLIGALCIALIPSLVRASDLPTYFGTTEYRGEHDMGSIFKSNGKKKPITLYSFCSIGTGYCYDGAYPLGNMRKLPDHSWVGTTSEGGDGGAGTIFRLYPTGDGFALTVVWSVCWTLDICNAYGTPRGTLAFMRIDKYGGYVLEGNCERRGSGVHYQLTLTTHGNAILPLDFWHRHSSSMQAPVIPYLGPEKLIASFPGKSD